MQIVLNLHMVSEKVMLTQNFHFQRAEASEFATVLTSRLGMEIKEHQTMTQSSANTVWIIQQTTWPSQKQQKHKLR